MDRRERVRRIDEILHARYPETTSLEFCGPFTLLVAAILAAQCTDERVNRVTRSLFQRFPDAAAFAAAPLETLESAIHPTGFYRQKAKTLKNCCAALVEKHGGQVPSVLEELVRLPGIGRKTAHLVLGNSLGVPGIFVDTHVKRIAYRLDLTDHTDPDTIEGDLAALVEPRRQVSFSNLLTHLGRDVCVARRPRCPGCAIGHLCPRKGVQPQRPAA
jgi:endonuclease-3